MLWHIAPELITWFSTLFLAAYAMIKSKDYSLGIAYILVGIASLLGLFLNHETAEAMSLFRLFDNWWLIEAFIFLNIVTGWSFYARYRKSRKLT